MSDLDLPALAEREKAKAREELIAPLKEIDFALKACTFGRFHVKLMAIAFVGAVAGVLTSSTTAYLLPLAECDLHMTLLQKGVLNGMPYMGMLLSSVAAGFLTDAFGRKIFLGLGFGGLFLFTVIAGSSQTYEVLVVAMFFEGVFFATSFSASVCLTAEFCHSGIRDRLMLCQSSFIAFAHILVAGLSWAILMNDWKYTFFDGKFVLNTWNIYLYMMSLWALVAGIMYVVFLPESPKYLLTQKRYDEAREILIKIYKQNTGKSADTYPYYNIWKDKKIHTIDEVPENEVEQNVRHQIVAGLHNIKPMFQKPLVVFLAMICLANFIIMSVYNVLRLWFPQVSAIVEHNPLEEGQNFCFILDKYTHSLKLASHNSTAGDVCVPTKSGQETYINSIIIGCVCLVPYLISGLLVNKVGKKILTTCAGIISIAASICLPWAGNKVAIVSLFATSVAIAQTMLSLNQAFIVEYFPTTSRTMAFSLVMMIGRIGSLSGNIAFPIMLNISCSIPFFTISGSMFFVIAVTLFLPKKK